jgi:hypothetical protein
VGYTLDSWHTLVHPNGQPKWSLDLSSASAHLNEIIILCGPPLPLGAGSHRGEREANRSVCGQRNGIRGTSMCRAIPREREVSSDV